MDTRNYHKQFDIDYLEHTGTRLDIECAVGNATAYP